MCSDQLAARFEPILPNITNWLNERAPENGIQSLRADFVTGELEIHMPLADSDQHEIYRGLRVASN